MPNDWQFEANKILAHPERVHAWLEGSPGAPVTLELDVSLVCNDRCPMCVHAFAHSKTFLDLADIRRILSDADGVGIKGVTLSGGGEPLCHPETPAILSHLRDLRLSRGLITNGGMVRAEGLARELVSTFSWIRVSLDAGSETGFQKVRGASGLLRRLACIQRLAEARRTESSTCELGVSFLTSSDMITDFEPACRMVMDLGFDYIQFKPKIAWLYNDHHASPSCDQEGVFSAIERLTRLQRPGFRVLFSGKKYAMEANLLAPVYRGFHGAWFVASVGPTRAHGTVKPTLFLDCSAKYLTRWQIGQFDSLDEILTSAKRRQMIENTSSADYCVPAEKHATYNSLLEQLMMRHMSRPLTIEELTNLAPASVKHPFSI